MIVPLGPANDTWCTPDGVPQVRIEIRAAELSDLATSYATPSESQGWIDWSKDRLCEKGVSRDQWDAGWLGREIHEHGRLRGMTPSGSDGASEEIAR